MKLLRDRDQSSPRRRRRERVLKHIAVLPSLATLGNLVCGLGAIYLCLLSVQAGGGEPLRGGGNARFFAGLFPTIIAIAAYLLVVAMFFDAIDGRLARFTRKTSEFGAQLDSLADMVSFGVAPAVIVLCIVRPEDVAALTAPQRVYWRAEWVMAAIFVCCTALRLARFNVENEENESAHMGFRGLPSPGAAAALIGLVIFHQDLLPDLAHERTSKIVAGLMPPFVAVLGLLMVSRFRYVHIVNALLRGRRPFHQVVAMVIVFLVGLIVSFQLTIAVVAAAYALSGPVAGGLRKVLRRGQTGEGSHEIPLEDEADTVGDDAEDGEDRFDDRDGDDTVRHAV